MSTPSEQSLEYIRQYYKVPAYAGKRVTYMGKQAVIEGGNRQYLKLRFDDPEQCDDGNYHPTWEIEYLEEED